MGRVGKALYKAIPSLDYRQTFNYYNDQFLMGNLLSLYFCKVMRLAGIPPSAGKEKRPQGRSLLMREETWCSYGTADSLGSTKSFTEHITHLILPITP